MRSLSVIRDKAQAAVLIQGDRGRLLGLLREPASAAGLAKSIGLPRQKVNYHLRELEKAGLIRLVEERRARNCIERIVQATASAYILSPEIVAELGANPEERRDRFSASYLLSLAARTIREVGALLDRAQSEKKRLATLSLETDIRFATAADRNAFAEELTGLVAQLAARHQDASAPHGRNFRFQVGLYPGPTGPVPDQKEREDHHDT